MENISLHRVEQGEAQEWAFIYSVFEEAFPIEEYRELESQRELARSRDNFYQFIILDSETPIGILAYWDFDDFIFGEHLAIVAAHRSGGIGSKLLKWQFERTARPWVLEVEMPESSDMAARRIGLYERLGVRLIDDIGYHQPSYRGGEALPLRLMVYGESEFNFDFGAHQARVIETIYKEAYGVK